MPLSKGQLCADRLIAWLNPFCERIEVAGSIRRGRPEVGDVDLVCIPRVMEEMDMFGTVVNRRNLTLEEIRRRCAKEGWCGGPEGSNYVQWTAGGIQVDLWFTTPKEWTSVLLCRTGSARHNIWLAELAKASGGHWNPHHGLRLQSGLVDAHDEAAIYSALGVVFIPPRERDYPQFLRYLP